MATALRHDLWPTAAAMGTPQKQSNPGIAPLRKQAYPEPGIAAAAKRSPSPVVISPAASAVHADTSPSSTAVDKERAAVADSASQPASSTDTCSQHSDQMSEPGEESQHAASGQAASLQPSAKQLQDSEAVIERLEKALKLFSGRGLPSDCLQQIDDLLPEQPEQPNNRRSRAVWKGCFRQKADAVFRLGEHLQARLGPMQTHLRAFKLSEVNQHIFDEFLTHFSRQMDAYRALQDGIHGIVQHGDYEAGVGAVNDSLVEAKQTVTGLLDHELSILKQLTIFRDLVSMQALWCKNHSLCQSPQLAVCDSHFSLICFQKPYRIPFFETVRLAWVKCWGMLNGSLHHHKCSCLVE